jgi:hypothetical protein
VLTGVNTGLLISGKERIFNVRKYFVVTLNDDDDDDNNNNNNNNNNSGKELDLNVRTFSIKIT